MAAREATTEEILSAAARVPDDVVYRDFPAEVVFLNLQTGQYHGLNRTAGRMVRALEEHQTVAQALDHLTAEFAQPQERIRHDLLGLVRALRERGLLVVDLRADGGGD
jgi:hypothetical protein